MRARCLRWALLVTGLAIGLLVGPVAVADDVSPQATPIVTQPGGIVDSGEGDAATLSLTLDSDTIIQLPDLEPGTERVVSGAASVTIAPGGGPWTVTCEVAFGADHSTSAGIDSLSVRRSDTPDWQSLGATPESCASGGNEGANVLFDLRIVVPQDASPGTLELIVTFTVSAT